ncbi:hypothetical protein AB1K54_13525 [Microbacterium sp. BWT-B31]|uniref:hypothetical protein n=1 Tax=Microbacterium sp. BWT-B31 TaxID=3232072 RepID=UPI003528BB5E
MPAPVAAGAPEPGVAGKPEPVAAVPAPAGTPQPVAAGTPVPAPGAGKPGAVAEAPAPSPAHADSGAQEPPVGVIMVGMALVAWWPAFTLGAWGEVFWDDLMALWAASVAAFVFVLVEKRRPLWRKFASAFVLLLPSVWVALSFIVRTHREDDLAAVIVDLSAFAAVILGIPFTLVVLVRVIWPDFRSETTRRRRWLIVSVVAGVVAISFTLGLNQSRFLNCEDFTLSGNSLPPDCTPLDAPAPD